MRPSPALLVVVVVTLVATASAAAGPAGPVPPAPDGAARVIPPRDRTPPVPLPLALSDGLTVSMAVFQLVFSAVVSISLWRLTAWQRRYEGLEGKLHETTARLVDERFRAMTHEVNSHVQGLVLALEEMKQRVHMADTEFRAMGERDQKIELTVANKIDLLKDYIRDFAAGKKDLEKHEFAVDRKLGQVELRLGDLTSSVAVLSDRVKE